MTGGPVTGGMCPAVVRSSAGLARAALTLMASAMLAGTASPPRRLVPIDGGILFLPRAERDRRFAHMERWYASRPVRAGGHIRALPRGAPLPIAADVVDAFMARAHVAGLVVLQDGRIRLERYPPGRSASDRWTSFSVTKSVTSTLIGAAVRDGSIHSVDDPVSRYLPRLGGSAYDGVTIAQLLAMRSGVAWSEDYADPASDVVRLYGFRPPAGEERTVAYMRRRRRAALPGGRWLYDTGETDLAGELLRAATGRPLAHYLSIAVWRRYGMASEARWLVDAQGHEAGGSGLSMTARDAARFGQLALEGGAGIVPAGWFAEATRARTTVDAAGSGYGRFWWTYPEGRFAARGIFGQDIVVDRERRVVIATAADWPVATDPALSRERARFEALLIAAAGPASSRPQ